MRERNLLQYFMVTLRGLAMGAADVVPGVSGGTIAFITGIYEELIDGLSRFNLKALKVWRKEGFKAFWRHVNGTFFFALFLGIIISILSLSKLILWLLQKNPVLVWSFFFGLVLASVYIMAKSIEKWKVGVVIALIVGTAIAGYISSIETTTVGVKGWYIFLSGAIAICAMILPGISGAFILVLLGSYQLVLEGLHDRDLTLIGLFAAGCIIGLIVFSKLLKYLFDNFKSITLATLTGFLIGSLYKIWPWKNKVGGDAAEPIVIHSDGRNEYMMTNTMPSNYEGNNQLYLALALMLAGLLLIVVMEKFAPKKA